MTRIFALPAACAFAFLCLPALGLLLRAPWSDLAGIYGDPEVASAVRISLTTATAATLLSAVLGVPLAWLLARSTARITPLVRAVVLVPLVLPPVVGGVALFAAFGRRGFIGEHLPFQLPFSQPGIVMAQTFVAMPFLVLAAEGAFRAADRHLEEAAATLGATPLRSFRTVTVPLAAPSLLAGAVLCWARALGEFGATITFGGGNVPYRTAVMPTEIYFAFERDPETAIALSLLLMAIAVFVFVLLRERWLRPVLR